MDSLKSNQPSYCAIPALGNQPPLFDHVPAHKNPTLPKYAAVFVTAVALTILALVGMSSFSNRSSSSGSFLQRVMPAQQQSVAATNGMRLPSLGNQISALPGYVYNPTGSVEEIHGSTLSSMGYGVRAPASSTNEKWCHYNIQKQPNGVRWECACQYSDGFSMISNNDDRDALMNCLNTEVQAFCGLAPNYGSSWLGQKMYSTAQKCCGVIHGSFSVGKKAQCY